MIIVRKYLHLLCRYFRGFVLHRFSKNTNKKSIWPLDETLTGTTTLGLRGPVINSTLFTTNTSYFWLTHSLIKTICEISLNTRLSGGVYNSKLSWRRSYSHGSSSLIFEKCYRLRKRGFPKLISCENLLWWRICSEQDKSALFWWGVLFYAGDTVKVF